MPVFIALWASLMLSLLPRLLRDIGAQGSTGFSIIAHHAILPTAGIVDPGEGTRHIPNDGRP